MWSYKARGNVVKTACVDEPIISTVKKLAKWERGWEKVVVEKKEEEEEERKVHERDRICVMQWNLPPAKQTFFEEETS